MSSRQPRIAVLGLFGQSVFIGVDHFHAPGETVHGHSLYSEPGGKGYNQAVAARRLGAQVRFFGCGGEDESCAACEQYLQGEGIEGYIEHTRESATSYACILTDSTGANRVTVYRGAADRFSGGFIEQNRGALTDCDILLINNEYPHEVNRAAVQLAQQQNIPVIFNPAPARDLSMEWVRSCWLITPNEQEAAALLGLAGEPDCAALARGFRAAGIERAVVTLGGDGALVWEGGRALRYPAIAVRAVDTTGAGDTFNAALAVALGQGRTLCQAAEYAMNAAAISVERRFVMPGLPTAAEVAARYVSLTPQKIPTEPI